MKTLLVLASLLTAGAFSANAQTGTTTTTTRQTTATPATMNPDQTVTPSSTTTTESTTTSDNNTMSAHTGKGKTVIQPAPGTKVKDNGKRIKIK
ncbi:MAG: hypothetical protein ACRYFZ_26815 [Janthinobacterium lividum]